MKRAVFLDRDGLLIEEKHYLHDPAEVVIFPGAARALKRLMNAGYLLFIVTNQAGIGRGYFTEADMQAVHDHLVAEFAKDDVRFEKIYFAPEHPDAESYGRKPKPQFLFDARDEFGIILAESYMAGDKLIDLQCGWNAGVKRSFLTRTGYGTEWEPKLSEEDAARAIVVDGLPEMADWIIKNADSE